MEENRAEGGLPPGSEGKLDSSNTSSAALSSFFGDENPAGSWSSVGGLRASAAVHANRGDVRVTGTDAGKEGSSSRRRNRVPYSLDGKRKDASSRRHRSLTPPLLLLSLAFLLLRHLVVKCGHLLSKARRTDNVEAFNEGPVHRLLASRGAGDEEGHGQETPPFPGASLAACTQDVQEAVLYSPPVRPDVRGGSLEQLTGQETSVPAGGVEVRRGGRKRKSLHVPGDEDHPGLPPPTKQSMRDPEGLLAAHPLMLAILTEPLSPPGTSSRTTSEAQAEEEGASFMGPSATRQAIVFEELSDSDDEGETEEQQRRLMTERRELPREDSFGPLRDGSVGGEESGNYVSEADLWLNPAAVHFFQQCAGPYLASFVLDTREKQNQWVKTGVPIRQAKIALRQTLKRVRSNENSVSLLSVYRTLLLIQFYIVRGVLVSKANFHYMGLDFARRLRAAQTCIETTLLRTGVPPAFVSAVQTLFTEMVAKLAIPLNALAVRRGRQQGQRQEEAHGEGDTPRQSRKTQKGDPAFAEQLEADKAAFSKALTTNMWVVELIEWLSRQPPSFAQAVPPNSVLGRMMRGWSLLPAEALTPGADAEATSPDEMLDDLPDVGDTDGMSRESILVFAGQDYRPLASLTELLPILVPAFSPGMIPLDRHSFYGGDGAQWRESITDLLIGIRGRLWWRLKALRESGHKQAATMTSLLAHLALTDFILSEARYAMEMVPELKLHREFRWICGAAERTAFFLWSRLGLYKKATAWARRGLATIVVDTLSRRSFQPQASTSPAELNARVIEDLKLQLTSTNLCQQLSEWMSSNPDQPASIDIIPRSRLLRVFASEGLTWLPVSTTTRSTALTPSPHTPPQPHHQPPPLGPPLPESSPAWFAGLPFASPSLPSRPSGNVVVEDSSDEDDVFPE